MISSKNLILKRGKIGEIYFFDDNGKKPNSWIVKKILEILDKPENLIIHVRNRKNLDVRYVVDFDKVQIKLKFKSKRM